MKQLFCKKEDTKVVIDKISKNDKEVTSVCFESLNINELEQITKAIKNNHFIKSVQINLTLDAYALSSKVEFSIWEKEREIHRKCTENSANTIPEIKIDHSL